MAVKATKRTTVRDLIAAAQLGAVDVDSEVLTAEDHDAEMASAESSVTISAERSTSGSHECDVPGCTHGAAHGPAQPDRQLKLECPECGAVARMTARAVAKSVAHGGGIRCGADGATFNVAARRTYTARAR